MNKNFFKPRNQFSNLKQSSELKIKEAIDRSWEFNVISKQVAPS